MEISADQVVLTSAPGPEHLVALLVLFIALLGALVSVSMARRGRVEGWSMVGLFGLLIVVSLFALVHMPTRLAFDRAGAEVAYGPLHSRRAWADLAKIDVERRWGGLMLRFTPRTESGKLPPWSGWPGLFVPALPLEPRQITMRIEEWKLSPGR